MYASASPPPITCAARVFLIGVRRSDGWAEGFDAPGFGSG